jgi:hypothetical protein
MLIVEGADLVGKTTLCRDFIKGTGHTHQYCHFGLLSEDWDYYHDYLQFVHARVVMDRFFLSELVYGTVIPERDPGFSSLGLDLLQSYARLTGAYTVVIVTAGTTLKNRYFERPEHFSLDVVLSANALFRELCLGHSLNGYRPVIDHEIHLSSKEEFVTPSMLENLIECYRKHVSEIASICNE